MNKYIFETSSTEGYTESFTVYAYTRNQAYRLAKVHPKALDNVQLIGWY
jgi:hypothetical protein